MATPEDKIYVLSRLRQFLYDSFEYVKPQVSENSSDKEKYKKLPSRNNPVAYFYEQIEIEFAGDEERIQIGKKFFRKSYLMLIEEGITVLENAAKPTVDEDALMG